MATGACLLDGCLDPDANVTGRDGKTIVRLLESARGTEAEAIDRNYWRVLVEEVEADRLLGGSWKKWTQLDGNS